MEFPVLPHPYACVSNTEGETYLWLPLDSEVFSTLPETISVFDLSLTKRPEFHITIGCLPHILARASLEPTEEREKNMLSVFTDFVHTNPLSFQAFTNDMRYAVQNERRSIVVRCTVSNIDELYKKWEQLLGAPLGSQPTHVTLYALAPYPGIGIHTMDDMENLPVVSLPQVEAALGIG